MRRGTVLLVTFVGLYSGACGGLFGSGGRATPGYDPAGSSAALADVWMGQVQTRRGEAQAAPGAMQPATLFAIAVQSTVNAGVADTRPELGRTALADEAIGYLELANAAEPAQAGTGHYFIGQMRTLKGDTPGAEQAWRAALAASPNLAPLPPLLDILVADGRTAEVPAVCQAARQGVTMADSLHVLMTTCAEHGDPLTWVQPADRAAYEAEAARVAAQSAAHQAERERESAALRASFGQGGGGGGGGGSGAGGGGGAAGPDTTPVSVSFRCVCSHDVRMFYGDKPGYSSGRTTTASGNSVWSDTLRPGDVVWVLDASDRGVASTTISRGTSSVTVDCGGFR